ECGHEFSRGRVDRRAQIDGWSPRVGGAVTLREPKIGAAETSWSIRREIQTAPVLGDSGADVCEFGIHIGDEYWCAPFGKPGRSLGSRARRAKHCKYHQS